MADLTGIVCWYGGDISGELRRAALLFDRILFRHAHSVGECKAFQDTDEGRATLRTVELLKGRGMLESAPVTSPPTPRRSVKHRNGTLTEDDLLYLREVEDTLNEDQKLYGFGTLLRLKLGGYDTFKNTDTWKEGWRYRDAVARRLANYLRTTELIDAIPVVSSISLPRPLSTAQRVTVLQVVLKAIPSPSADTSWEAIWEFKQDKENQDRYYRLRRWLARAVEGETSIAEFEDEFIGLLADLRSSIRRHHKEIELKSVKVLLKAAADVIDDLVHLKVGAAVGLLVDLTSRSHRLLKAEIESPGRDLAYILQAQSRFQAAPRE